MIVSAQAGFFDAASAHAVTVLKLFPKFFACSLHVFCAYKRFTFTSAFSSDEATRV